MTIGPGHYTPAGGASHFEYNAPGAVTIVGAGRSQTVLEAPNANPFDAVLRMVGSSGQSSVSDLGIAVPAKVSLDGLRLHLADAHDISITAPAGANNVIGVQADSSSLEHVDVDVAAADRSIGFWFTDDGAGTPISATDSTFSSSEIGAYLTGPSTLKRVRIESNVAVEAPSGPQNVSNSLLLAHGTGGMGLWARDTGQTQVNASNVTIAAVGDGPTTGVNAVENNSGTTVINIAKSIVSGYPTPLRASGTHGTNSAIIAGDYIADGGGPHAQSGSGLVTGFGSHFDGSPGFVDPAHGDFRLGAGSTLLDRYPGTSHDSGTDLDGNPRYVHDADADGNPDLDLGAYEYQRRAPAAAASATPMSAGMGEAIGFSAAGSNDPDDGDTLSYAWAFDDGASATGASATHAFATPGSHTGTLTVTDPTGQQSTAGVTVTVRAAPSSQPLVADLAQPGATQPTSPVDLTCSAVKKGTKRGDVLHGSPLGDLLEGLAGNDKLSGGAGDDCLLGGNGDDKLNGGAGKDQLVGGPGKDTLVGGSGKDSFSGGPGNDTIDSRDGVKETVNCGSGHDSVRADTADKLQSCERVKRH